MVSGSIQQHNMTGLLSLNPQLNSDIMSWKIICCPLCHSKQFNSKLLSQCTGKVHLQPLNAVHSQKFNGTPNNSKLCSLLENFLSLAMRNKAEAVLPMCTLVEHVLFDK